MNNIFWELPLNFNKIDNNHTPTRINRDNKYYYESLVKTRTLRYFLVYSGDDEFVNLNKFVKSFLSVNKYLI